MNTLKNTLLTTAISVLAVSNAFADSGTFNATASIAAPIIITETAPLSFGLVGVGTANATLEINAGGGGGSVVVSAGDYIALSGGQAAELSITGTANTSVLFTVDDAQADAGNGVLFKNFSCGTGGGAETADCRLTSGGMSVDIDGTGVGTVVIGGKVDFAGPHPTPVAVYSATINVTANYL